MLPTSSNALFIPSYPFLPPIAEALIAMLNSLGSNSETSLIMNHIAPTPFICHGVKPPSTLI